MFDQSILNLTTHKKKRDAIKDAIIRARDAETLTYTDIMLSDPEIVTFAFEVLDGVRLDSNNVPQYMVDGTIDLGQVRLVAIDPNYDIKLHVWESVRIPGTGLEQANKTVKTVHYGNDVTLDDRYDLGRPPRQILRTHGWPIKQFHSRSGMVGDVVEWKWFERVAQSADAGEDYRELYKTLKARLDASQTKIKAAPAAGRSQEQRP